MSVTESDDHGEEGLYLVEPRFSLSLQRGLAVLNCYTPDHPILGIADLADMIDANRTTTHRYVTTLVALGYLRQLENRKYCLAFGVTRLGLEAMNATSLADHAQPFMFELWKHAGLTVSLAVLDGSSLLRVDHAWGSRGPRRGAAVASGSPHNTALGKVLLAFLPRDVRRQMVGELTLAKTGPRTITNKKSLNRELTEIRWEDGPAEADEELASRVVEIAAPVRNGADEVVAAVGLAAATRIDVETLARELGPHLAVAADGISGRLGFRRAGKPRGGTSDLHRFRLEGHDG